MENEMLDAIYEMLCCECQGCSEFEACDTEPQEESCMKHGNWGEIELAVREFIEEVNSNGI